MFPDPPHPNFGSGNTSTRLVPKPHPPHAECDFEDETSRLVLRQEHIRTSLLFSAVMMMSSSKVVKQLCVPL